MTKNEPTRAARLLGFLALLVVLLPVPSAPAHAADPTPAPSPAAGQRQTFSGRAPLPRGLVQGLAGLAAAGTLVGLGAASASLRERDDEPYDSFIEHAPR